MRLTIFLLAAVVAGLRFYGITHPAYQAVAHGLVFSMFSLAAWTYWHPEKKWHETDDHVIANCEFFSLVGSILTAVEVYCAWPLIVSGLGKLAGWFVG